MGKAEEEYKSEQEMTYEEIYIEAGCPLEWPEPEKDIAEEFRWQKSMKEFLSKIREQNPEIYGPKN